ncbi:MAG: sigma-70 family RNA polymerase sigma factor [Planctomycetes bacterium]|nr:sigma-70 family RNA polymerase sigma factor [Planctomycetota bacterium]
MARDLCMERTPTALNATAASDDELVQRFYAHAHADPEALETLLARHADISFRVALRMTGNAADAEEIVQRAFLEVVQGKNRFAQASAFRTWLVGIVVNTARMWAREERRRKQREEIAVQMREQTVVEPQEGHAVLQKAAVDMVRDLPEHYRLPVWMHYFEGLTFREIAGVLEQPEGTIRSQASRGLDALRQQLVTAGYAAPAAVLPGLLAAAPLEAAPQVLVASLKTLVGKGALSAGASATAGTAGTAASSKGSVFLGSLALKGAVGLVAAAAIAGGAMLVGGSDGPKPPDAKVQTVQEPPPQPPAAPVAGPQTPVSGPQAKGWRGDWTGRWPDATPPTVWGRFNKIIDDHRCQSAKPKGAKPENDEALTHGQLLEWLVAGPFDVKDSTKELDEAYINETEVQPNTGEKAGEAEWKAWTGTGVKMATLNNYGHVGVSFTRLFGQVQNKAAYAHTYVYSPAGGAFRLRFSTNQSTRVWCNGQLVSTRITTVQHIPQVVDVTLKPGWNRLLVKSAWGSGKADGEWSAWKFAVYLEQKDKPQYETKNIVWTVPLPSSSIAAPLIMGDRIFVTSDPYFVACFSKSDGKCQWIHSMTSFEMFTEEEKKGIPDCDAKAKPVLAEMAAALDAYQKGSGTKLLEAAEKKVSALVKESDPSRAERLNAWEQSQPGWTNTPCSDGKRLYVWCQTGAAACYEFDGKLVWSRQEIFPGDRHHGYSISPVLIGGKFISMQNEMRAYDAETGKTAWTVKGVTLAWGSLVPVKAAGQDAVLSTEGTLVNVADGKVLWGPAKLGSSIVSTPVTNGGDIFFGHYSGKDISAFKLPSSAGEDVKQVWSASGAKVEVGAGWAGGTSGSPIYYDGLLYQVTMTGVLICRDASTGALVYAQELNCAPQMGYVGTPGMSASLSMAGKYIYATDNTFVTIVFEPGRTFKQVAKNVIQMEGEGQVWSYPVFDGSRMYYRAPRNLYCIGEK